MASETAYFGAGCFWHPQEVFDTTPGVIETVVGYMGGDDDKHGNPTYQQVCSDATGHAEITKVIFDPKKISYEQLIDVFWKIHDPTQYNRQGPDVGSQYRSILFYTGEKQKTIAERSKKAIQEKQIGKRVFTEIKPTQKFHEAEEYHQKYGEKNR